MLNVLGCHKAAGPKVQVAGYSTSFNTLDKVGAIKLLPNQKGKGQERKG